MFNHKKMNVNKINSEFLRNKKVHFCGIGGIGMSAIARLMKIKGFDVSGSDSKNSDIITILNSENISSKSNHSKSLITQDIGCVVYTSSINLDENEEIIQAKSLKIPLIHRADALRILSEKYKSIAISGTHGKTSNTAILGYIMDKCQKDPAIICGGIMKEYKANYKFGLGDYMVFEADESDGSFCDTKPEISMISNVEKDHMIYHKTLENIEKLFVDLISRSKYSVVCVDDPILKKIANASDKIITYGAENADFIYKDITFDADFTTFKILHKNQEFKVKTLLLGCHNVQNITGCIAAASLAGCDIQQAIDSLSEFSGTMRRFSLIGKIDEMLVVDDYAHNPAKILAASNACRQYMKMKDKNGRLIGIFQPHKFSRTAELYEEFLPNFKNFDKLFVTNVYSAGETESFGIDLNRFIWDINQKSNCNAEFIEYHDLVKKLKSLSPSADDLAMFIGAGDITQYAKNSCDILF